MGLSLRLRPAATRRQACAVTMRVCMPPLILHQPRGSVIGIPLLKRDRAERAKARRVDVVCCAAAQCADTEASMEAFLVSVQPNRSSSGSRHARVRRAPGSSLTRSRETARSCAPPFMSKSTPGLWGRVEDTILRTPLACFGPTFRPHPIHIRVLPRSCGFTLYL